jgi:hypothetical protein
MARNQNNGSYKATYGSNIYKSGNRYRVRVSVGGNRNDAYVTTLNEARSLRRTWKSEQAEA